MQFTFSSLLPTFNIVTQHQQGLRSEELTFRNSLAIHTVATKGRPLSYHPAALFTNDIATAFANPLVQQNTITSVLPAKTTMNFMEIPPELRNMIYIYLLGSRDRILLTYTRVNDVLISQNCRGADKEFEILRTSPSSCGPCQKLSIFQTSKDVYREAALIKCGEVVFGARNLNTVYNWLFLICERRQASRNVYFGYNGSRQSGAIRFFKQCPRLRMMKINLGPSTHALHWAYRYDSKPAGFLNAWCIRELRQVRGIEDLEINPDKFETRFVTKRSLPTTIG